MDSILFEVIKYLIFSLSRSSSDAKKEFHQLTSNVCNRDFGGKWEKEWERSVLTLGSRTLNIYDIR